MSVYVRPIQAITMISRIAFAGLIRCYQALIGPLFPPSCRFYPSCSEYTREAVLKYGAIKGSWMGIRRIIRCNPFHDGGHDPIP